MWRGWQHAAQRVGRAEGLRQLQTWRAGNAADPERRFLERLSAGEDPRRHSGRSTYAADDATWATLRSSLTRQGLIRALGPVGYELTSDGLQLVEQRRYESVEAPKQLLAVLRSRS